MKVLHSALMLSPVSGIINQMKWEQAAANDIDLDWDVRIFCPQYASLSGDVFEFSKVVRVKGQKTLQRRALDYVKFRMEYYAWLDKCAETYDLLLLRYSTSDPFQYSFIRRCKKPVYLVHHTLEIPELRAIGGIGSRLRIAAERFCLPRNYRAASGFIGVTREIVDLRPNDGNDASKGTYCYANGINCSEFFVDGSLTSNKADGVPTLIFVASSFNRWHGLDLLLEGVRKSNRKFRLHIVGNVGEEEKAIAANDPRIFLHGHVSQEKLSRLIEQADLGLSSFALNRNKMEEACPLKSREYLVQGLPIYAGHRDIFPDDCGFYKVGRPDIEDILRFRDEIVEKSRVEISNAAYPFIEKKRLLKGLHEWLEMQYRSSSAI